MAGTTAAGGSRRGGIVGINITPMVDVMLVLLVILMVSAQYIVEQSMKVDLPKTSTSDGAVSSLAAVTITADHHLLFNQEPVTEAQLRAKLDQAYASNHDVSLVVSADQAALHGDVVHVMDLAKVAGISKFAINVVRHE